MAKSAYELGQGCFFPGLVAIAGVKHPIPSRTRPLSAPALMVLRLKTWESKSPPDLERSIPFLSNDITREAQNLAHGAGWSSPVARQAHNLKAAGSNPAPATKSYNNIKCLEPDPNSRVLCVAIYVNAMSTF